MQRKKCNIYMKNKKLNALLLTLIIFTTFSLTPLTTQAIFKTNSTPKWTCNFVQISGNVGDTLSVEFYDGTFISTDYTISSSNVEKVGKSLKLTSGGVGTLSFKIKNETIKLPFSITGKSNTPIPSPNPVKTPTPTTTPKPTTPATSVDNGQKDGDDNLYQNPISKPQDSTIFIETIDDLYPNGIKFFVNNTNNSIKCRNGELDLSTLTLKEDTKHSLYIYKERQAQNTFVAYKVGDFEISGDRVILLKSGSPKGEVTVSVASISYNIDAYTSDLK